MKHYQDEFIEKPELIFEDTKEVFEISIYRPVGNYILKYRTPREEQSEVLIEWLTGGDDGCLSPETDQYGVVKLFGNIKEAGDLYSLLDGDLNPKKIKEIKDLLSGTNDKAKDLSEFRVMRAVKSTYENLRKQWELNDENNFGRHVPSKSEYLCLEVMKQHFKNRKTKEVDLMKKMQEFIQEAPEEMLKKPTAS